MQPDLRAALADAYPGADVVAEDRLKSRVHRVVLATGGSETAVVAKRLTASTAERNRMLAERWLPAAGLGELGPPVLACPPVREGVSWQLYEDLGKPREVTRESVATVLRAAARLHATFATHPLLPECRMALGERGAGFLTTRVQDARRGITALQARGERPELCARIAALLDDVAAQLDDRALALATHGGPDTLLHGDLWPANTFVLGGGRVRFIDWDRAAVGPLAYDVSTLLSRLPATWRTWALDVYRAALAEHGIELPGSAQLRAAFAAAELARCVDRLVWPTVALLMGENVEWAWDELPEVASWFDGIDEAAA